MDRTKKVLISLLVLGALAAVGAGTYASFNATTTNAGNTFATGTLTLSNTANAGSACFSYNSGNNQISGTNTGSCNVLINLASNAKPGYAGATPAGTGPVAGGLILKNGGSITPSTFDWSGSCTSTSAAPTSPGGTGDLCLGTSMYVDVQEETSTSVTTSTTLNSSTASVTLSASLPGSLPLGSTVLVVNNNSGTLTTLPLVVAAAYTTGTSLTVYPPSYASGTFGGTGTNTIYVPATNGCWLGATLTSNTNACTIDDTQSAITNYSSSFAPSHYTLSTIPTSAAAAPNSETLGGATPTRYFAITTFLTNNTNTGISTAADNGYQGLTASFSLTWQIGQ